MRDQIMQEDLTSTDQRQKSSRSLAILLPVSIFMGIAVLLGIGLTMDPREVPSPLIDKPVPVF